MWVDKSSELYNRSMTSFLQNKDIEMYSTHDERKYGIAERLIRTLKNKIYKYMTSVSKNVYIDTYIDTLDDIVNKYNNTYHSSIEMKAVDIKSNTYTDSSKELNDEDHQFKTGDTVRISKYKNISAKGYPPNWSEETSVIKG